MERDIPTDDLECSLEHDTEVVIPETNLGSVAQLVERSIEEFSPGDTAIDRAVAVEFHRALPISRRVASDRRVWHYLGLIRFPEFVCHRFQKRRGRDGIMRRALERFAGDRVRNGFARLWWAAELTRDENGNYNLTEALLDSPGFQDNYEAFFGRAFCAYRPALKVFIELMANKTENVVRKTAKAFGHVLTTVVLESQSEDNLRDIVAELAAECAA